MSSADAVERDEGELSIEDAAQGFVRMPQVKRALLHEGITGTGP